MSEKVLFYAPDVDGYRETLNWPRTFFTADSGAFEITNKTDPYNQSAIEPIPKFKVSAQYTFFTQKDVAIFESLMRKAKEEFIYMPLWFSLMQLDGPYDLLSSGTTVSVEAPEGNPWNALDTTNYLHFTAWALGYLTSSATEARSNTFFIRFDNSDKYTYTLITDPLISTVDLTNEEINFASDPTSLVGGNDKDLVAPVIKVNVTGVDFSYNMTASQIMTATVQMEEL